MKHFAFFFFIVSLWKPVCSWHSTAQFRQATFQVLKSHVWLVAAVSSAGLGIKKTCYFLLQKLVFSLHYQREKISNVKF